MIKIPKLAALFGSESKGTLITEEDLRRQLHLINVSERFYYDAQKYHVKDEGAFTMNGPFPRFYYISYAYLCADITERDALTGVEWALCAESPDGFNALYRYDADAGWGFIENRPGRDEENLKVTAYIEEMRADGIYVSKTLTGDDWVKDVDMADLLAHINAEAEAREAAVTQEAQARDGADNALQNAIDAEAEAREAAVTQEAQARDGAIAAAVKTTLEDQDASPVLPPVTETPFSELLQKTRNTLKYLRDFGGGGGSGSAEKVQGLVKERGRGDKHGRKFIDENRRVDGSDDRAHAAH
jgi:hypothetical protein